MNDLNRAQLDFVELFNSGVCPYGASANLLQEAYIASGAISVTDPQAAHHIPLIYNPEPASESERLRLQILENEYRAYLAEGGDLSYQDWLANVQGGQSDSASTLFSGGTQGPRSALRQNMIDDPSLGLGGLTGWQAHHIVPWELRNHPLTTSLGMNFNDVANGIALPCTSPNDSCLSTHSGPHRLYTAAVRNFLNRVDSLDVSDDEKRSLVEASIEEARQELLSGSPPLRDRDRDGDGATTQAWDKVFNRVF